VRNVPGAFDFYKLTVGGVRFKRTGPLEIFLAKLVPDLGATCPFRPAAVSAGAIKVDRAEP
jgi:hypothetical protein